MARFTGSVYGAVGDNRAMPKPTTFSLRRATGADAPAVAAMHIRAWRVAYRGIVPDAHLDSLDVATRAARYDFGATAPGAPATWIAVDGADVVGFVTVGPGRDKDLPGLGEVCAVYVAPDRWRSGAGSALLAKAEALLGDAGLNDAYLWVLEDNTRARRFYERAGWAPDGARKVVEIGGRPLAEVRCRKTAAGTPTPMKNRQPVVPSIRTERAELVSMSLAFMRALVRGDGNAARREMNADLPVDLREQLGNFLNYRIPTLEADPASQPWLGRGIVWTHPDGRRELIGTIGFHSAPDETGRVEIGYRIEPAFRRRGITTECVRALLAWAETQGVHRFRASVAPGNVASLAVIGSFGFRQVGVQMDEIDGEELVFDLDRPTGSGNGAGD
jgi:RimJ/RimL family protein N-acetyltransferase